MLNARIADNGHLIFVTEDGQEVDAGNVRGIPGPTGEKGPKGDKGDSGQNGDPGQQGKPGTNLPGHATGYVNAGTFVALDNIKATVTTSGNRGLSVASVTGSFTAMISSTIGYINGGGGAATNGGQTYTYNTTPSGSLFGYNFPNAGDGSVYLVNDTTNQRFYRITLMIGYGYLNNFISIERLC